jgi:hypothetical protein
MGVLNENVRDYPNFPGKLRVAPWYFTKIPDPDRLLSTHGTLKKGLRYI